MPEIEVTQDVKVEASVRFQVDRDVWNGMSDHEKVSLIGRKLDFASVAMNEAVRLDEATLLGVNIYGPDNADIDLEKIEICDAAEFDADNTVPSP